MTTLSITKPKVSNETMDFYNRLEQNINVIGTALNKCKRLFDYAPHMVVKHQQDHLITLQKNQQELQFQISTCNLLVQLGVYDPFSNTVLFKEELTTAVSLLKAKLENFKQVVFAHKKVNNLL